MSYDDWKLMTPEENREYITGKKEVPRQIGMAITVKVYVTVEAYDRDEAAWTAIDKVADMLKAADDTAFIAAQEG